MFLLLFCFVCVCVCLCVCVCACMRARLCVCVCRSGSKCNSQFCQDAQHDALQASGISPQALKLALKFLWLQLALAFFRAACGSFGFSLRCGCAALRPPSFSLRCGCAALRPPSRLRRASAAFAALRVPCATCAAAPSRRSQTESRSRRRRGGSRGHRIEAACAPGAEARHRPGLLDGRGVASDRHTYRRCASWSGQVFVWR